MPHNSHFQSFRRAWRIARAAERRGTSTSEVFERLEESAWTRRAFVHTALGASAALLAGAARRRAVGGAGGPRVVIVGAGLAGLTCAYRLARRGVVARVLEASPRVGGRVYSLRDVFADGQIGEMGGEAIDADHRSILSLAAELDLGIVDLAQSGPHADRFMVAGRQISDERQLVDILRPVARAANDEDGVEEACGGKHSDLDAMSIAEWLDDNDIDPVATAIIAAAYLAEYGLEIDRQNALNLLCDIDEDEGDLSPNDEDVERYRIAGGNDTLATALAARLARPVELGQEVTAVRAGGGGALEVVVRGGASIAAEVLVLAVPLGVLRVIDLSGVPLGARTREAIRDLGFATQSKLLVCLSSRPTENANILTDQRFQCCWESSIGMPGRSAIVTNLVGGSAGAAHRESEAEAWKNQFIGDTSAYLPGMADALTGKFRAQCWPRQTLTRGSYTCFLPGQNERFSDAFATPQGRVFFCGEHTADDYGYMESAVSSGERAASQVLGKLA